MGILEYQLHVEELMRFRHYLVVTCHVWPALPAGARATLTLPDGSDITLAVENRGRHSALLAECLVGKSGQSVEESRLSIDLGKDGVVEFHPLSASMPPDPWAGMFGDFQTHAKALRNVKVLELGSRTRDATAYVAHGDLFTDPSVDYTGLDIVTGPNVDVVGDAHTLSGHFPAASFDLVMSNWIFEHLMMPWLVVLEINKVLKPGGELFINTNQSIGLHDVPWDFWRFSDSAWRGLLNEFTGFEITRTALGEPVRLTPMRYHAGFSGHEGGAGFQASAVWARKISDTSLQWNVDSRELHSRLARAYPKQMTD